MQALDYGKISITAKLVAYVRQFCDIPFSEDVASFIKAEDALKELASKISNGSESTANELVNTTKAMAPLIEARYKCTSILIERSGIVQVLELASGFSMRGLAMSRSTTLNYVETDLPEINVEKQKLVALLREKYQLPDIGRYHSASANALTREELENAAGELDRSKPLVVVNEGLLPYLTMDEQERVARNVRDLLGKFAGGIWITPDFTTKQIANADMSEERRRFRNAVNGATERPLHDGAFDSENEIFEFINSHGFDGLKLDQNEIVTELVSPGRLNLDSGAVERLKTRMAIWQLSAR